MSALRRTWRIALTDRVFRLKLLITPGVFIVYAALTQPLCEFVEIRKGIQLDDKLLNLVPVVDCSMPIFLLLYSSLSLVTITHLNKPRIVMRILEMHILVAMTRQACILLVPLEPPVGTLFLRDVFLENTFYPPQVPMTKDLFFSGHVASLWIYFLCTQRRNLKIYFALATLFMGAMLLSMRVHYSYDLYGAVAATTIIYSSLYRTRRQSIKAVYLWVKNVPNKSG